MAKNTWRPFWVDVRELRPCLPTTDIGFWVMAANEAAAKSRVSYFLRNDFHRNIGTGGLRVPKPNNRPQTAEQSRWLGVKPDRLRRHEYRFHSYMELSAGRDD